MNADALARSVIVVCLLLICVCGCIDSPSEHTAAPVTSQSIEDTLAAIRTMPAGRQYDFMHGNACPEIQYLMIARDRATRALCREADRCDAERDRETLHVIFDVLGFVKDPDSISWLRGNLQGPKARFLMGFWLDRWQPLVMDIPCSTLKWVRRPESWAEFLVDWVRMERDEALRLKILRALASWVHCRKGLEFFSSLWALANSPAEEMLIAALYLKREGRLDGVDRLNQCIDALKDSDEGRETLLRYARELKCELFIPWLLTVANVTPTPTTFGDAESTLKAITFRQDVSGKEGWKAWYDQHRGEHRDIWLKGAMTEFTSLFSRDQVQARAFVSRAVYTWNDIRLLPWIKEWAKSPFLHNEISGWINLTYHPYYRDALRPIAEEIIRTSRGSLEDWAKDLLRGLDFLEDRGDTWERFVERANRRM